MRKGENPRSWKGQVERVVEPVRHRWQMANANPSNARVDAPLRGLQRKLAVLVFLSVAMLSAFIYLLLHSPIKTPLITVGTRNYVWPLPPNSWVQEDVDGLATLQGKSVHWRDSSKAWQTKSACLEDLQTQLREASPLAKRAGAIVLYINMHGAVNEEGEACLIPPVASSVATTQWIRIEEIVSTIVANKPSGVNVLLVLDCVHQQVNWNIAQLNNTFTDRLDDWASKSCPESIVVLSACAPDQRSWSGAELHNSIFGRELRLGLAGEADRLNTSSQSSSGNGDGEVSMKELLNYLSIKVDAWAQTHRGTSQTPRVMSGPFQDFRLAWALKSGELARQNASVQHGDLAASSPSSTEMDELWRSMAELRSMAVYQYDPKSWADLEQKLLWLEQLSQSGAGYAELSEKQVFPALSKRLKDSVERAKASITSQNQIAKSNILLERTETVELPSHLPSLALQEFVGEITSKSANDLRTRIQNASIDSGLSVPSIVASSGLAPKASQWNELNFLGIAKKYDCLSSWPDNSVIQDLFEARDRCERLAVQGDVRVHRWLRPALLKLDNERRKAEDQLILGPVNSLLVEISQTPWSGLQMAMAQFDGDGDALSTKIGFALRLRDQGFSEIPYLANWVCSPGTMFDNLAQWNKSGPESEADQIANQLLDNSQVVTSAFQREELALQELNRLIAGLHELSEILSRVSELGEGNRDQLDEVVTQVNRDFSSMRALVQDHIKRAGRESAELPKTVLEVESLLMLPFLEFDDRVSLRKLLLEKLRDSVVVTSSKSASFESLASIIRSRFNNSSLNTTEETTSKAISASKPNRYADRMRNWGVHPLGKILLLKDDLSLESTASPENAKANDRERELNAIDIGNSRLRQLYQSMQLFDSSRVVDWCQSAGVEPNLEMDSDMWSKCAFSEQFERAIAALCPIPFESNNALTYRRIAFKDLLFWYANRISEDFYADFGTEANNIPSMPTNAESYFERTVHQVLDYASSIKVDTGDMAKLDRATREKVQELGSIARNGIQTTVKLSAIGGDASQNRYEVNVRPALFSLIDGRQWNLPIPKGFGALLVRSAKGISNERRLEVAMPVIGEQAAYQLTPQLLDTSLANEAVLVYRGHEFRSPMSAGQGIVVDFQPNHIDSAELVLFGDTKRQASIVFVLDCSWSMGEKIPVEAVALKSQSRLELAKSSILQMVTQIASRPDARVGVRLFGHRLGWSRPADAKNGANSGKTQVLVQPNYPESIPNDLVPSRDVEAILPLGRFSTEMVGDLSNKLSRIVPWGQSPLYFSIIESFRDFEADDNTTAKSIVVITDGDNFQFNASGRPGGEPSEITSIDAVYRAWNSNKVPLFILGVGVSDSSDAMARKNLLDLAERTEGKYYDIENGSDLVRALSEQLSLGTFEVSTIDLKSRGKNLSMVGEAKLNTPVEIARVSNNPYEVSFQSISKSVQFSGGESLELYLTEDGQDIVSKPYDKSSPRSATLVRPGASGRMIARVHRPSLRKNGVNFPISIQDPDSHYTPRPSQLWIEVTPVAANSESSKQTYYFYDTNYEPKTPVPLVSWNASNWPVNATEADIRVWAKYEPTPNLQSIPIEQVKQNLQRYVDGIAVNGIEGVKLGVNIIDGRVDSGGLEVQITESHSDRSKGVGAIRVGLETDESIVPSRVTHLFEPANNLAIHTFEFDAATADLLMGSSRSRITIQSRSATHEGAWQLQGGQPIRVEVTTVPESLPSPFLLPMQE